MKKILFVIYSLEGGGAEKSLVNLLNEIPEKKYSIDLLLFKKTGIFLEQVPKHVRVLETPKALTKLYGPLAKGGIYSFFKIITTLLSRIFENKEENYSPFRWKYFYTKIVKKLNREYDVAIAYLSGDPMFYVGDKVKAKKKIYWVHNDYLSDKHPKKYEYKYFKESSAIVTVSQVCLEILNKVFPEFKEKSFYLENITSDKIIRKKAVEFYPEEYKINKEIRLLTIGRLTYQKGLDLGIEAAKILKEWKLEFTWFILGTGEEKDKIVELIKKYKLEKEVILLGIKENPYPYIRNCDIFIQPSRYEGKSVVLDEAKILAKPIVVTNYPTVKDQIINDKEGHIVNLDSISIAKGIREVMEDKNLYNKIENYLKNNNYGNEKEISKYIKIFDK